MCKTKRFGWKHSVFLKREARKNRMKYLRATGSLQCVTNHRQTASMFDRFLNTNLSRIILELLIVSSGNLDYVYARERYISRLYFEEPLVTFYAEYIFQQVEI